MYDYASGVEVYVRAHQLDEEENDSRYPEYEVPRLSPHYTGDPRIRYIEAITDQRFEIVVALHEDFSFKGRSSVQIYHELDGGSHVSVAFLERSERPQRGAYKNVCCEAHMPVDGVWKAYGFVFGETCPSEDVHLSAEEEAEELERRGVITVYLERGRTTKCREPVDDPTEFEQSEILPRETTRAVAIEHGKTHSLQTILVDDEMDGPRYPMKYWTCAQGKGSEQLKFTIFYRSRAFLEKEGIMPSSSSTDHRLDDGFLSNTNVRGVRRLTSNRNGRNDDEQPLRARREAEIESDATRSSNIESEGAGSDAPSRRARTYSRELSVSLHQRKRRRGHPPANIIDLCSDEEMSPPPRVKAEPPADMNSPYTTDISSGIYHNANGASEIKSEPQSRPSIDAESNATPDSSKATTNRTKKAKERNMINLQLEEIRLKKRLAELDSEDDE